MGATRTLMTTFDVQAITDKNLVDQLGFDKQEIGQATLQLAAEEIGLQNWEPSPEDLAAFERVHELEALNEEMLKTDNFRNLLVSQAADMRVILLLIAGCVVLMRRVKDNGAIEARRRLSTEAAYIYAPLAHKLGLYKLKSELEDLSLKYLEHDAYYMIKDALNATKQSRDAYIERFLAPIHQMLTAAGLRYHMKGRTKSIHSIWQKMKKQHCTFDKVYDLFAIRIILDSPSEREVADCWKVFSLITNRYESNLKRLRDWVTMPKSNGYESLHVTVLGPENKWVEVQIRTERMDEVAEHGLAAHWRYKGVKSSEEGVDNWLANIRAALEAGKDPHVDNGMSAGLKDHSIYVFTPKGDLFKLPVGSTVLDFAYLIHSKIGNRCVGGIVDGKNVPLRQPLSSGQRVEILTSNTQQPRMEWLNIATSGHAKSKIRQALREMKSRDSAMGKEVLERKLKNRKLEWDERSLNQLIKKLNYKETGDFYSDIVENRVDLNAVLDTYVELQKRDAGVAERAETRSAEDYNFTDTATAYEGGEDDVLVINNTNLKGVEFRMARCCHPVYGDPVFGFVTVAGGINIHRESCPNARDMIERFPYRVVKARWAGKGGSTYPITLHVVGQDDLGIVNNITSIISKEEHIMLRNISIESNDGLFYGELTVLVDDTTQLNSLIKKLRTVKGVKAVGR